jgi:hypothetical protein
VRQLKKDDIAMNRWSIAGLLVLVGLAGSFVLAQDTKGISWEYGLSFQVRKAGQNAFTEAAAKYGAEVFVDKDMNQLVYIAETASIGTGPSAKLQKGQEVKSPLLFYALEVKVRPAGEGSFEKAKKFSSEVFKDPNSDNLVYISETGSLAVTSGTGVSAPDKVKNPDWFHGLEMKVRKAGEKEFGEGTKKVSLEVYKDENTNHLFYITDAGAIAVIPATGATKPAEVKTPVWYHAFEVKVRKADEKMFTKDTKTYGVEVYKDENAGTLIYVSETGAIAVVPLGGLAKPSSSKEPKWLYGRAFRVRKADEKDFNDKTQSFGAEVYKDESSGNLVYISETGALVVTPGK